jgi:hypothetical protein
MMHAHRPVTPLARFSRPARILVTAVAATLAIGGTAALASSTATWTVKPGGAVSIVTAKLTLTDPKTGTTLTCTSAKLTGTLKSGSGLQGTAAGSVRKVSFTKCTWPHGVNPDLSTALLPWHINLTSYKDGVVAGTVSGIGLQTTNGACVAAITGHGKSGFNGVAKFTYNDTTNAGTLTGENLHVVNEICAARLYQVGDPINLSASFSMHPAQAITSP